MRTKILSLFSAMLLMTISTIAANKIEIATKLTIKLLKDPSESVAIGVNGLAGNDINQKVFHLKLINGTGIMELPIKELSGITIYVGKNSIQGRSDVGSFGESIWIEPGDNLKITIPTVKSLVNEDVLITGKGSEKARMLNDFHNQFKRIWYSKSYMEGPFRVYKTPEDEVLSLFESDKATDSLKKVYQKRVSTTVTSQLKASWMYLIYASMFPGGSLRLNDPSFVKQFRFFEEHFPLTSKIAQEKWFKFARTDFNLVRRAVVNYAIQHNLSDDYSLLNNYSQVPRIVRDYYKIPTISNRILTTYFKDMLKRKGLSDSLVIAAKGFVNETGANDPEIAAFAHFFTNATGNLIPGSKVMGFALRDQNNVVVNFSDFTGKVVLLDFMFNGCGGCKEMVPALEKVEGKYQNRDIVFISISIDNTFERFKGAIGEYNTKSSIHLYTNGQGSQHDIIKYYSIIGYPTLVLIDKKGNLITARAPRADSNEKELTTLIDHALVN